MAKTDSSAARQALDLMGNQMTLTDLAQLTNTERRRFATILHHWLMLAGKEAAK